MISFKKKFDIKNISALIFDLDQTLVDTKHLKNLRDSRNWKEVYRLIDTVKPYPLIDTIITRLNNIEIKTAIVTSSPSQYCKKILELYKWEFNTIVTYHDTRNKKPNPEPILLAVKRLELKPKNVISLGDRTIDVLASRNAGVISAACLWDSDEEAEILKLKPDLIFRSTLDLNSFLLTPGT